MLNIFFKKEKRLDLLANNTHKITKFKLMEKNYQTHTQRLGKKITVKTFLFLIVTIFLSGATKSQSTYTFNVAGATGRYGPTQTQVNTSYTNTNLMGLVTASNGIQSFTVNGGLYRITAIGARGGNTTGYLGGKGVSMQGDFQINGTSVLNIIVGQQGEDLSSGYNTGGGGGSFVWINGQSTPLIVAGGGGGAGAGFDGSHAVITTSGTVGSYGNGTPGTGGNGANPGGAGWYSDGVDFVSGVSCTAKCSGNVGGVTTGGASHTAIVVYHGCAGTDVTGDGGFGGASGGNGYCSSSFGAGGGGGYSGGVGQSGANGYASGGGGAGSFNAGTNPVNTASFSVGNGTVIIQELCNMSLVASGSSSSVAPSICSGQSVTLTTNGVSSFSWSNGNTTSSVIVVSPSATTVYTVSALTASNCTASRSMTVTVSGGLPVLAITNTPSTAICVGKSVTLTASGALSYSWAGGATTVTNGVGFFPTATTVYTVTGTNGCGQSTASTTITIAPLVVTASTTSSLVCQGSTVVLTATSAVNGYTWAPIVSSNNPVTLAPQANTIYTVTASDGTCIGTATVAVNTNPIPTINVVASSTLVCDGSVVTLTASGASTFTWTGQSSNSAVISVTPVGSTNYQVSGSNSFGCSSNGAQIVITKAAPVLTVTATKTLVCVGGSVNITANGASTYAWVNGPATPGNLVNPTGLTTYSVVGTGTNGCPSPEYMITINTLSTNLSVSAATTAICEGGSTTLTATGANTYTWTGIPSSQGVAMVSPATTTVYTVTASTTVTGLSCPSTTNISITVNSNPTITVIATKTVVCRTDANITLTASGGVTYSWSANTNSASTTSGNVSVHPTTLNNNIYSVTGMNANGCINTGSVTINVKTCTGIEELKGIGNSVMVYPNPSHGEFNVSNDSEITLKVVNELGQEVRVLSLTKENNFKGSVTNLPNGVYFLTGQNASGKINQKVIVTK
ncbi:hypothetical protein CNR22_09905 [Sphingobacteriaceae bacterium]|nr:hypothetical protein CNR22_09905 [Sphingobacteriaceae bacterium]